MRRPSGSRSTTSPAAPACRAPRSTSCSGRARGSSTRSASTSSSARASIGVREAIANPDPRATVRDGIRSGAHVYAANRDVLRALFSMAQLDGDAFAGAVERMLDDRRRHMQRLARRLDDAGALRAGVTRAQAAHILWLLTGFEAFDTLYDGQGLDAEAVADLLVASAEGSVLA